MDKRKMRSVLIVVNALLLLILIGICAFIFLSQGPARGKILENVSIAGIQVGGLTVEEAKELLDQEAAKVYTTPMTVNVDPYMVTISPDTAKVSLDVERAVQDAYNYGRTGNFALRKAERDTAATTGYTLALQPYLQLDNQAISAQLETFLELFASELTQTSYELLGEAPDLTLPAEEITPQTLVITKGTSLYSLDLAELNQAVLDGYATGNFSVRAECTVTKPDDMYIQSIYDDLCSAPVDAVMDEDFQISREINGYTFDLDSACQTFTALAEGQSMEVTFCVTVPEVSYQDLYDSLFQDELGSCKAFQASNSDRSTNLRIACEAVNGLIIMPGQTFSYNDTLGERTPEKGYKPAPGYEDGESVLSYGGGICQVSSAIYYSCLHADLQIVRRACHMFPSSYVPLGMDATVFWNSLDFKFKNNFNYPILIKAEADDRGTVTVKLMGTDEKDYYIRMEYVVEETFEPETKEVEMEADNPDGYKDGDVITTPYTGYDVITYKYKYSKADDSLISRNKEATSHYDKRDKVVAKIRPEETEPTLPTDPVSTEPVPSEPLSDNTVSPDI